MRSICLFFIVILVFYCLPIYGRNIKSSGGTYRYVHKNSGRTHYVGATNNFNRRHKEHVRSGHYYTGSNYNFKKNYMTTSNKKHLANIEKNQIKKHNPIANKYKGGGGL